MAERARACFRSQAQRAIFPPCLVTRTTQHLRRAQTRAAQSILNMSGVSCNRDAVKMLLHARRMELPRLPIGLQCLRLVRVGQGKAGRSSKRES